MPLVRGRPTDFWGKLRRDDAGDVVAWHPLVDHSVDVAAVCEALLTQTILGARLGRLAGRELDDPVTIARLSFIALLHDLGKFHRGFQNKAFPGRQPRNGHVAAALRLFKRGPTHPAFCALDPEKLSSWGDEAVSKLLWASISHHGQPATEDSVADAGWDAGDGLDPAAGIKRLCELGRKAFPDAFADGPSLPKAPPFQHAYAGLVTLADWIGSDPQTFPYTDETGARSRIDFAREAARDILQRLGLDARCRRAGLDARCRRAGLGLERPAFSCLSDAWVPNAVQRAVLELDVDAPYGSLTLIESETGSGKTEAALARFLALFHAGLVDGMYFALPTRTAATQLHGRIYQMLRHALQSEDPQVVLAVPGYLVVDEDRGELLPGFEVLWNDRDPHFDRARRWAAENPKRFLAAPHAVGTIDQVLLSALAVDHAHLRATALSRHLLVVDEVHASDSYSTRLLETVLEAHLSAGGHALLLSATLGTSAEARLFGVLDRLSGSRVSSPPMPPIDEAIARPYPLITHVAVPDDLEKARGLQPIRIAPERAGRSKRVALELTKKLLEPEEFAKRALAEARRGALVIVLRNTVADCVATQLALERSTPPGERTLLFGASGVHAPHHSRFARVDRVLLDEALERRFGKNADRELGAVVVATQTVQQSLDLDADVLLTDLAPMDVLLQRIGRVHRHDRPRRPEYRVARVVVSAPPDLGSYLDATGELRGPAGIGRIYEDARVLEATRLMLVETQEIEIPRDNRRLVERTTHPCVLDRFAADRDERWQKHAENVKGRYSAQRKIAGDQTYDRRKSFGEESFPDAVLGTRLGQRDRVVKLVGPVEGPFGRPVASLTIPHWMVKGTEDFPGEIEVERDEVESDGVALRFEVDGRRFVYDRLGLRRDDDSGEDADE